MPKIFTKNISWYIILVWKPIQKIQERSYMEEKDKKYVYLFEEGNAKPAGDTAYLVDCKNEGYSWR